MLKSAVVLLVLLFNNLVFASDMTKKFQAIIF